MSYRRTITSLTIFLLISTTLVYASVTGTLGESEEKTFTVNGVDYQVRLDFIGSTSAKFTHNEVLSSSVQTGESHTFTDGLTIKLDNITTEDQFVGAWFAHFTLSVAASCGDGTCSAEETCQLDNCCNGALIDFNTDADNCGGCDITCSPTQTCSSGVCETVPYCGDGVCNENESCSTCNQDCACDNLERCESNACVTFCGNGACDPNENYESCSEDCEKSVICGDGTCDTAEKDCCDDCGCSPGFDCKNNECISLDECFLDSECNDNDKCTIDVCSGIPKKCFNSVNDSCIQQQIKESESRNIQKNESSRKITSELVPDLPETEKNKKKYFIRKCSTRKHQ